MTVNVYKGKSVTTLIAAAKDGKDHSKVVLPVLRAHPQDQIYPGLALYYKETGAQQLKVAQKLFNLLDKVSEGSTGNRVLGILKSQIPPPKSNS